MLSDQLVGRAGPPFPDNHVAHDHDDHDDHDDHNDHDDHHDHDEHTFLP